MKVPVDRVSAGTQIGGVVRRPTLQWALGLSDEKRPMLLLQVFEGAPASPPTGGGARRQTHRSGRASLLVGCLCFT